MNLHEYQAKDLLRQYQIPTPSGFLAYSLEEALQHAMKQQGNGWVIKSQVHAGGRGKAGGVKLANTIKQVEEFAISMLGSRLITKQSHPHGQPVNCILIQQKIDISRELYFGMVVDRGTKRIAMMASAEGGMDIEELAATSPEKITNIAIDPIMGLQKYQSAHIAYALALNKEQQQQFLHITQQFYQLFCDKDLSLIEINPLAIDAQGQLLCLDAKIVVDDNALYRQAKLSECYDVSQDDDKEAIARQYALNYVTLNGNIACMVNGAGLAMATMDIIKLCGGEPANFLDVGGSITADKVTEAFKLIISDPDIKAILINIFGGIVRCDLIADGIITAVKEIGIKVPVVVRLEGTHFEQGKTILTESDLQFIIASDLEDAAHKSVAAAKGLC